MKRGWLLDVLIGLSLTLFAVACYLLPGVLPFLENVELKSYDRRSALRQSVDVSNGEIVLIAIDDNSIAQIGRWPWPRSRVAALLDKLAPAHPKAIGLDIIYSEPEQNQGLAEIASLRDQYDELLKERKVIDRKQSVAALFEAAKVRLDSDTKLLASLKQTPGVVLPMAFADGVMGAKPQALPPVLSSSTVRVQVVQDAELKALRDQQPIYPIVPFAEAVSAVGHVNLYPDSDGVLRRESPVLHYGDSYVPSYALELAAAFLGVKNDDILFVPGRQIKIGKGAIPLDEDNRMLVTFNGPAGTFRSVSFEDVITDKVSPDLFKDKVVIVGLTATGVSTLYVTPVAQALPSPEVVANVIENVLHGKFLTRPAWAKRLELGLIAFVGLFIMLALPRLKALWGFLVSFLLMLVIFGLGTYLFVNGQWLKVSYPTALLGLGYLLVISKRFFVTEKGKELVEASAIETNKMLGLSFQGQGMLDMAFEKFRLCPLDDNMKDTLYNLALDFERKRQFSKAAAVLDHVAKKDPKYKDIAEKTKMLKQAGEGAVFGGLGGAKKEGTVLISGGSTKPTLGRYEIEKELGRGAMGIVYLGRDPKINRQVAIKTMMLEEGSDAAEAKAVKERFFREAESAGTLNHPNIVRIFDAGEEQDIAYIAMELLEGHDFTRYTTKEGLLPPLQAMEYVAVVAEALDYAHQQGIVHRDIKPANFMLLKDGTVRVADFGIARITASSKTATGTVMGTPSYMSPEQVAGKKVDGRSDLFSLSVALFELVTGEKPFKGGEGIGTLLFQIANEPHPDALQINPALPPCLAAILNKGLAKNPDERYARGSAMAADLRNCVAAAKSGGPVPMAAAAAPPLDGVKTQPVVAAVDATAPVLPAARPDGVRTIEIPLEGTLEIAAPAASSEATIRLTKSEDPS